MKKNLTLGGTYHLEVWSKDGELKSSQDFTNAIVNTGMERVLDVMFNGTGASANFYCGLLDTASPTLANSDTMTSNSWTENAAYAAATRPEWVTAAAASRAVSNGTSMDFAINTASQTIGGIFICDNSSKSGTAGLLFSTGTFSSAVSAGDGDTIKVTYSVQG
jgi:uncharacterized protein (DUF849 family)